MTALEASLKRRLGALETECETLASAVDRLSIQLQEAYQLLGKYEPGFVAEKLGVTYSTVDDGEVSTGAP